jgi:outer membrane protein TolC
MFKSGSLLALWVICALAAGQDAPPPSTPSAEVLTLDQALSLALAHNRQVQNAALEESKQREGIAISKTNLFPVFSVNVLEGHLLQDVKLTFPAGFFGTLPVIGPIPRDPKSLVTPAQWTTFAYGGVDQPLTQLYRAHLGVRAQELSRGIAHQQYLLQRQTTADDVKRAYYGLLQTQAAMDATRQQAELYREMDRVTDQYLAQQAVLKSDSLDVKTRLANSEYQETVLRNTLATQKESFNTLLAREVRTQFAVTPLEEITTYTLDADLARQKAAAQRPEIQQARLKVQQAEYDRRSTKSLYIPDLSATLRVISPLDAQLDPKNIATAGFFLSWEPFDWGRKRHQLSQKSMTIDEARNGLADTESQVLVDVDNRFRKTQEAEALLKVTRLTVETEQERVRVITNKYKQQAALLKDVLQEQAQLASANQQYQQALAQYWTARADLEKAMGEE